MPSHLWFIALANNCGAEFIISENAKARGVVSNDEVSVHSYSLFHTCASLCRPAGLQVLWLAFWICRFLIALYQDTGAPCPEAQWSAAEALSARRLRRKRRRRWKSKEGFRKQLLRLAILNMEIHYELEYHKAICCESEWSWNLWRCVVWMSRVALLGWLIHS